MPRALLCICQEPKGTLYITACEISTSLLKEILYSWAAKGESCYVDRKVAKILNPHLPINSWPALLTKLGKDGDKMISRWKVYSTGLLLLDILAGSSCFLVKQSTFKHASPDPAGRASLKACCKTWAANAAASEPLWPSKTASR